MAEINKTKYYSDHEVSSLYNNTEKLDEEKNVDGSYYLTSDRISSSQKYSESSLDKALKKIINGKRKDKQSSIVEKKLKLKIYTKPSYLTKKHIQSWVNTGYLPFQTISNNAEVVDTDSLNEKQSYYNTCNQVTDTVYKQGLVDMDGSDTIKLYDNNSFNCSSVDTTAYILSNSKTKKKNESMATVVNNKSPNKILSKNTLHQNTSLEKDETQNVSMSNACDSNTKHTQNKTKENDNNIENDTILNETINMENSFSLRPSKHKKLYTGRDSPMDIVVTQFKNTNILDAKKNLHPAFRSSPPPEKSSKKSSQKRKKRSFAKNDFIKKSLDNKTTNNLEEETCNTKKETDFIDFVDNLTIFQYSMPSERMQLSCKALVEQIKRFPTLDYIKDVNNIKRCPKKRKSETKKAFSKETSTDSTTDDISKDSQQILQSELNPCVILERLPEEVIQCYTKKKTLQTPKEKLMESNKINDEDMCNDSNLETCLNTTNSILNCTIVSKDSIDSGASTILYNNNNVSVSDNFNESDCSTVILCPVHSSNPDNVNNKSDKDLEQNQSDRNEKQNQSNEVTEENQLDKDLEQNQLNKVTDKTSNNCLGTNLDTDLDKELDKDLNKNINDEKVKCLKPVVAIKRLNIQSRENNSNDIKIKTSIRSINKRRKHISRKLRSYYSQLQKEERTTISNNISNNTSPIVMFKNSRDLKSLKKDHTLSSKEKLNKLISSDSKLSIRPIVKLKRLLPKNNVKSLHKSNNKRYQDSSKNDKVQIKKKKSRDNLGENNNLSVDSSNSMRNESSLGQKIRSTRTKRLPIFYTTNNDSTHHYDSDSNSESNSDSELNTSQPFMECILHFYKNNKKQRERKNTKLLNDNNDMVKSINQLMLSNYTDKNSSVQTRSHSNKNLSIIHNVNTLLSNARMNEIEVNMTCSSGNKQCNTTLKRVARKTSSFKKENKKRSIVNKKNKSRKKIFCTQVYETESDSSRSE
ncbi:PREDICTED: putative leucine-rich repeat-containing protein DDB_G0290503 [Polistes dominula]|uniref:Leucine-rich repeat-containing protein DDB_G0290503 n=1 Tax=Polistes dominula TaxID=743375 RepID=A0ABM1IXT5_POLDO|nr:PREDICTED: putative leucine-rich repeat-containing protein DDB_G0290503 [Polistes dominula]